MGKSASPRTRPLTHLPFTVGAVLAALISITGCADVIHEFSKSDVSATELSSTLLRASDLPGWTVSAQEDSAPADRAMERIKDQVCDLDAAQLSSTYISPEEDLSAWSTAEPVCGGWRAALEVTLAAEATYRQIYQDTLAATVAEEGIGLSDFRYQRVDLGLGEQSLVYLVTATLRGPGVTVSYESYEITQLTDYLATSVIVEGYGRPVDRNLLLRLASVVSGRMASLG